MMIWQENETINTCVNKTPRSNARVLIMKSFVGEKTFSRALWKDPLGVKSSVTVSLCEYKVMTHVLSLLKKKINYIGSF